MSPAPTRRTVLKAAVGGAAVATGVANSSQSSSAATSPLTTANWMRDLNGGTLLHRLTLPGTHDSCALTAKNGPSTFRDWVVAQTMAIPEQLASGIRAFDLRVFPDGPIGSQRLRLIHGDVPEVLGNYPQDIYLEDVLNQMNDFLAKSPSEALVVQIKYENPMDHDITDNPATVWNRMPSSCKSRLVIDKKSHSLQQLRGKIYMITRNPDYFPGLAWKNVADTVEDHWKCDGFDQKWTDHVEPALKRNMKFTEGQYKYPITFLSNNRFPITLPPNIYDMAWRDRGAKGYFDSYPLNGDNPARGGVNYALERFLDVNLKPMGKDGKPSVSLGMLMMDFPTDKRQGYWLQVQIAAYNYGRRYL